MKTVPVKLIDAVSWCLQVGGVVALAFMAVTVTYDALMRYVFAAPTSWSLEINSFLVVYLALMTAADVERRGEHIGITLVKDAASPSGKRIITILVSLVGIGFCAILAYRGWLMTHDSWSYGERVSSSFGTPNWIPYAMLPIGFTMLGLQFLLNIFRPHKVSDGEAQAVV
ncbi:TRAP transporter small permease [Fulvimarina sp. 2208YS6-2-32]|uniref:TRAP transporter small permease protein n=1 Tax=Fulvimarina uroteuthidis TaxID=3098149 RepID=A0ABU5I1W1_9HYPH|nr:TRAP transporter small permease [Fulvimarina sp. 2208YS6-2-32]MDY8108758.1 TRAP transporter small permease [Fulvimarina sp. 2208YS6-2-32]